MLITIAILVAAIAGFALGFRTAHQLGQALVAQSQRRTLDMLIKGRPTLDLIVAEMEKRRATKAEAVE